MNEINFYLCLFFIFKNLQIISQNQNNQSFKKSKLKQKQSIKFMKLDSLQEILQSGSFEEDNLQLNLSQIKDLNINSLVSKLLEFLHLQNLTVDLKCNSNWIDELNIFLNILPQFNNLLFLNIDLSNNKISQKLCKDLGVTLPGCKNLICLNLNLSNNSICCQSISYLAVSFPQIKYLKEIYLNLSYNLIDDQGLIHLGNSLRKSRSIIISKIFLWVNENSADGYKLFLNQLKKSQKLVKYKN
ncbi:hypothetical protein TTHERM_001080486 (macronuclear) [Tetrahymena thermophila SB210]|uniref:Uncharacterized protein n=1 Tax=Tetrahymena thermophila (strain SB210) TaxID=312017 RepID=W7X6L8_TETTS|nr:hypothetical protein TTHERM_001080486 [Tetrahymena thermophila SB210]EWS72018.1 hypothetical protein TTHERM_001080486 [Tetrahymena thermophila SB210]|eukprot:XP_012655448.1 hypothetical protein TTHERM_001080486 [Tetrahymena thermophila SB210]